MWLLYSRICRRRCGSAPERPGPESRHRARGAERQPVSLHRLPEDSGRGQPGGGSDAGPAMILLDSCRVIATMDDTGTELENGSLLIDGGVISWVGTGRPPVREQPEVLDGRGLVALPGLVNTHHHLYQTLTRVRAQQGGLFDWLRELYPTWATIDADWERTAAEVGLAELALSGCSTTTDHHYVFPSGATRSGCTHTAPRRRTRRPTAGQPSTGGPWSCWRPSALSVRMCGWRIASTSTMPTSSGWRRPGPPSPGARPRTCGWGRGSRR